MGRSFTPPFTEAQQMGLSLLPKLLSVPSWIGSSLIIQHVVRSPRRRGQLYHRLILAMSCMDWLFATWTFIGTWAIPQGTMGVYGARGTTETCVATGFLGQGSGLSSVLFNGTLNVYFLLTVRYGWTEQKSKKLQNVLMLLPLVLGWGTAIACLPLQQYNSIGVGCWIGAHPYGCLDSHRYKDEANCERGDNAWIYRLAFYEVWIFAVYLLSLTVMFLLYKFIRTHERANDNYRITEGSSSSRSRQRSSITSSNNCSRSRQFAFQALFYAYVFCCTWIWNAINILIEQEKGKFYTPILFLQAICVPSQGFLNALVYLRPRFLSFRRQHSELSILQLLKTGCRTVICTEETNVSASFHNNYEQENRSRVSRAFSWIGSGFKKHSSRQTGEEAERNPIEQCESVENRHAAATSSSGQAEKEETSAYLE